MQEREGNHVSRELLKEFAYEESTRRSPIGQFMRDVGETLLLTLVMFAIIRLAIQNYQVDGTSMLPTLQNQQYVIVDKLTYLFSSPKRGDIIVFEYPLDQTQDYIKRIIGTPGDHVNVSQNGQVTVNGVVLNEPYVNDNNNPYGPEAFTVGPNQYFVLGDNRGASSDSRDWGLVDKKLILGKAEIVIWPISNFHILPNEHQIFAHVPTGSVAPVLHESIPRETTQYTSKRLIALVLYPLPNAVAW